MNICLLLLYCLSPDTEDDYGMIRPSLIRQLRSVLDMYPDDGQILKVRPSLIKQLRSVLDMHPDDGQILKVSVYVPIQLINQHGLAYQLKWIHLYTQNIETLNDYVELICFMMFYSHLY